jgi:hypothetical protein
MGGPITYLTHPASMIRYISGYLFGPRYSNIVFNPQSKLLDKLAELGENDSVEVVVQEVLKSILDQDSDTWNRIRAHMEGGRVRGKIVVEIEH